MKSHKDRFVIIMAGGRGERFWPVSREKTPKQLIRLLGKKSFLQQTVERVSPVVPHKNILVITNARQEAAVREQLPQVPADHIIGEPCGRDTCAAVALGAALAGAKSPMATMAVLPADHVIPEEKKFQETLMDAFILAENEPVLVTIGIPPSEPSTGYGYIRVGQPLDRPRGVEMGKTLFHRAKAFVEKPNLRTAKAYLRSGDYKWNAGMFIWSYATLRTALEKHQPEMGAACQRWHDAAAKNRLKRVLARDYPGLKKISIDFALMEKAKNVVVADGDFGWDDLGAWTALARHLKPDNAGNCGVGDLVQVDSANNIIFDARTKNRTPIAAVGLEGSIVVQTDDVLLVASKDKAQKIKELVKQLSESNRYRKLI